MIFLLKNLKKIIKMNIIIQYILITNITEILNRIQVDSSYINLNLNSIQPKLNLD